MGWSTKWDWPLLKPLERLHRLGTQSAPGGTSLETKRRKVRRGIHLKRRRCSPFFSWISGLLGKFSPETIVVSFFFVASCVYKIYIYIYIYIYIHTYIYIHILWNQHPGTKRKNTCCRRQNAYTIGPKLGPQIWKLGYQFEYCGPILGSRIRSYSIRAASVLLPPQADSSTYPWYCIYIYICIHIYIYNVYDIYI